MRSDVEIHTRTVRSIARPRPWRHPIHWARLRRLARRADRQLSRWVDPRELDRQALEVERAILGQTDRRG